MESLIIDRPSKQSLQQKYVDNSLKVMLVLGWFYLFIPAITLVVWYIAYTFFNQHLLMLEGYKEYKTMTSVWYLLVIAAMLVLVLAWSQSMKLFHGKHDHNVTDTHLSVQESSDYYRVKEDDILEYRQMKHMTVSFDEEGYIVAVE